MSTDPTRWGDFSEALTDPPRCPRCGREEHGSLSLGACEGPDPSPSELVVLIGRLRQLLPGHDTATTRWADAVIAADARAAVSDEAPADERPVVLTDEGRPAVWMPLAVLTAIWRPGSADVREVDGRPWTWADESERLWGEQQDRMDRLATSLQDRGFDEAIIVACDGRTWDGHHRICVAMRLGIDTVPVEFVPFTGNWSDQPDVAPADPLAALRAMPEWQAWRAAEAAYRATADENWRAANQRFVAWRSAEQFLLDALVAAVGDPREQVSDLRTMQAAVAEFAGKAWPDLTIEVESLALAEEVGELARCVVKRAHGNRGTYQDWTAELRKEAGDCGLVLLNLAHLESFDLFDAMAERLAVILARDLDHDPVAAVGDRPDGYGVADQPEQDA